MGVIPGYDSAVVEYQNDLSEITDGIYAHELLHLHRYYVQNVPHLYPKKMVDGPSTAGMENWLEHVVIYERQLKMFPELLDSVDSDLQTFWNKCPWDTSGYELKFNLITRYLVTRRYCSAATKKAMREAIQKLAPPFSIKKASRRAEAVIGNKRNFVVSIFEFCGIPTKPFWLREYDTKNKRNIWYEI